MLGVGPQPLYCPWPRFFGYPPGRCLRIAPPALRGTSGSATMTTPGGAGTTHPPVLGTPASLLGSEPPQPPVRGSGSSLCPLCGRIIPDDRGVPLLEHLALSGRPDADFHASANFAGTEF